MRKSIILYTLLCAVSSGVSVAHAAVYDQVTQEYASRYDISLSEAERRLGIMNDYGRIKDVLEQNFGDDIAGIYFNNEDFKIVVRTTKKGQIIKDINKISDELGVKLEVLSNSPRNKKAIENIIENQGNRLIKQYEEVQGIGYDPKTDSILIYVYEKDESKKGNWLNNKKLEKISGMNARIVFEEGPLELIGDIKGGSALNLDAVHPTYRTPKCTAGFPAIRNGKYGLVSAAHCGTHNSEIGTQFYYQDNDGFTQKVTLTGYDTNPISATYHDIAFFESNDQNVKAIPYYYKDYSKNAIPVPGINEVAEGSFVCHFGRKTGFSCGNVVTTTFINSDRNGRKACVAGSGNCSNTFVRVEDPIYKQLDCDTGDSGGPTFSAYPVGLASSCIRKSDGNVLIYTKLKYAKNIGATILVY